MPERGLDENRSNKAVMVGALAEFTDLVKRSAVTSDQVGTAIHGLIQTMSGYAKPKLFVIEEMP